MKKRKIEHHTLPLLDSRSMAPTDAIIWRRSECPGTLDGRMQGRELCDRVVCRYHLLGDIARRSLAGDDEGAVESYRAWMDGEWQGHCVLDIAETGGASDREIAAMTGITSRLTALSAEGNDELRRRRFGFLVPCHPSYRVKTGDVGITRDGVMCRLVWWEYAGQRRIEAVFRLDQSIDSQPLFFAEID